MPSNDTTSNANLDLAVQAEVGLRIQRLRDEGLLTGPDPGGHFGVWVANTVANDVAPETVLEVARDHRLRPEGFAVLERLEEIRDRDGKAFFLLPVEISGDDARAAVLMTYVVNVRTDYASSGGTEFAETPYGSAEITRIRDRQAANRRLSYDHGVGFVHRNGGRLATTPNGMLMGLGGNVIQDLFSAKGGSTWGDIFMLNIDDVADPAEALRQVVRGGRSAHEEGGQVVLGTRDLDRLLHHEERHSRQWAERGYAGMIAAYGANAVWDWFHGGHGEHNRFEADAGLEDGGYRPADRSG